MFSASPTIQWFCDNGGTVRTITTTTSTMLLTMATTARKTHRVRFNCRYYSILQRKSIAFYATIFISLIFQYCRRFACCHLSIEGSWQISGFSERKRRCCCYRFCCCCCFCVTTKWLFAVSSRLFRFVIVFRLSVSFNFFFILVTNTHSIPGFFPEIPIQTVTVTVGIILLGASLISLLA